MYVGQATLSTGPTIEPLDPSEIRSHLLAEEGRDTDIASYAKAAREQIEEWTGRALMQQTWTLKLDNFPDSTYGIGADVYNRTAGSSILLPRPPLLSVTSIAYTDSASASQTVATTVYGVDTGSEPGRVYLKNGQVWPRDELDQPIPITITYVAGYSSSATVATARAAVPERIKQAIRLLTERYYDSGAEFFFGVEGHVLDRTIQALCWSFRVLEFA